MKQYTVITKDGSKWLRTPSPYNPETEPASTRWFHEEKCPDLLYIGSHPEGTIMDESEVGEVIQWRFHFESDWRVDPIDESEINYADMEAQTAYTDAEPPDIDYEKEMPHKQWPSTKYVARKVDGDRQITDNPRYPLFSHMSSEHGLTLLDSELDEIAHHAAPMTGVECWKRRCKIAESMIGMCPSDPKTYDEFCRLYDEWEQIIEEGRAYGN